MNIMKAYQVHKLGHPRDIQLSHDAPKPYVPEGHLLLDVYCTALNFFEILQAQGRYQNKLPLPFTLGAEFSGVVAADSPIPPGCEFKRGDRVFGHAQGAYAEQVAANPKGLLIKVPDGLSMEHAAAVPLTFTTSYEGLVHRGQVKKGEWVLVHAGAGGVGLAACQIAKILGAKVIATASSETKRRVCMEKAGVDATVDYTKSDWQKEVMRITGGHGADVVYDPVGLLLPSLKCIAFNGRLIVVGFAGGIIEKIPANLLLLKQVSVVGLYWGEVTKRDPAHAARVIKDLVRLLASGKLKPVIYEPIYEGLETVSQALTDLDERKVWGKGIVRVRREQRLSKL